MTFEIAQDVVGAYPHLRIGVVVATGLVNLGGSSELDRLSEEVVREFRRRYSVERVLDHGNIVAWRNTYRSFGVNPKKHVPTAEAFCRRIAKGSSVPWISRVVNAYLLAELEFFLPVGGYDLDLITGGIRLRYSPGGEDFAPLGAQPGLSFEKTQPGEIVYSDEGKVLTRSWNRKDSDLSKITEASTRIGLFVEAAEASISTSDVVGTTDRIKEYLGRFCGGGAHALLIEAKQQARCDLAF
jgi:DNA/RNA-binding domain of Phe-tRNA-synthetase-like protein